MSADDKKLLQAYPTLGSKILRRIRDVPWRLAKAREAILPTEFSDILRLVAPYTMLDYGRLRGLYNGVKYAASAGIPGDLVECGTARGGSAALLGLALKRNRLNRKLWVFDTFAGLPPPTLGDPDFELARPFTGTCLGTLAEVRELFERLQILENTVLVEGLFQDTLPRSEVRQISLLHLDGDWYESVLTCLNSLYDRVAPGGVIQIDDYGHWAGARKAVHEFLDRRSIRVHLRYLDYTGRQFLKPPANGQ